MVRFAALACVVWAVPAFAGEAARKAMAAANDHLTANRPADAVAALEAARTDDAERAFLALLAQSYTDAMRKLKLARSPDEAAIAALKAKLDGLAAPPDFLHQASELFRQATAQPAKFAQAASLFAKAMNDKVELSPSQRAAWAYCRVRVAAERFNQAQGSRTVAAEVAAEVADALALAPDHAELQRFGNAVLAATGPAAPKEAPSESPKPEAAAGWQLIEAGSFQVRFLGDAAAADAIAKRAEELRTALFAKWSGPPAGTWSPKCEIVVHATAEAFAATTGRPAAATGNARVKLDAGRATERRIDLRADDAGSLDDALPRELTHVILADLFPDTAPPRWAVEGMAVLAASPTEVERYLRTLPKCRQRGELMNVNELLMNKDVPADRVTGFAVGSVSLVDFLVRWKGEKAFTTFLRDARRYGTEAAVKRQYGAATVAQLNDLWLKDAAK